MLDWLEAMSDYIVDGNIDEGSMVITWRGKDLLISVALAEDDIEVDES